MHPVLGDEERDVVFAPVVHRDHVGVVEAGGHASLGAESFEEHLVAGQDPVEHLDRDLSTELGVIGEVHLTAGTHADQCNQAIPTTEDTTDVVATRLGHLPRLLPSTLGSAPPVPPDPAAPPPD